MRIELDHAGVRLGSRAVLRDVTLSFVEGEHVAVLGPSGAGKTTLLRLVVGALAPSAGRVRVDGVTPRDSRAGLMRLRRSMQDLQPGKPHLRGSL